MSLDLQLIHPQPKFSLDLELIISGVLGIVFSIGLFYDDDAPSHRLGAVFEVLGTGAFCATGILPEPMVIIHIAVSFVAVLLISTAALLIGGALIDKSRKQLGGLSIAGLSIVLGIIALAGLSLLSYLRSVAVIITFLALSIWTLVFGKNVVAHITSIVELTSISKRLNG